MKGCVLFKKGFADPFGAAEPQVIFSMLQTKSFRPRKAPADNPPHMAQPAGEANISGVKKPPMVQPPAKVAPRPMNTPPRAPHIYSSLGDLRKENWPDISAAKKAPSTRVISSNEIRCINRFFRF